jgi:hypothetical protein
MNYNGSGRKTKYYPDITTETLPRIAQCSGRESKRIPPKYEFRSLLPSSGSKNKTRDLQGQKQGTNEDESYTASHSEMVGMYRII